jgi:murein DD-endopeptidase MepM/ murein hydrolase activator NlpD
MYHHLQILGRIQKMRNDSAGQGHFGAPRGNRTHEGVDLEVQENEPVYSPISGVVRIGNPYAGESRWKLVEIKNANEAVKIMYMKPSVKNGDYVSAHSQIGVGDTISDKYQPTAMKNHLHVEHRINGNLVNPENSLLQIIKKNLLCH